MRVMRVMRATVKMLRIFICYSYIHTALFQQQINSKTQHQGNRFKLMKS